VSIERIKHVFLSIQTMHPDQFTDRELDLLESFGNQFQRKGKLSYDQIEILEEIYRRAQGR